MAELVRANLIANLAFFRRSRLLLAFLLVFLLITCISSLPPLFMHSGVQTFNALQGIFSELNEFLFFLAAGLGLFVISAHLRSRNLKMVFTKPCPPAVWLASAFLSAALVSFLLTGGVLLSALALSLIWHVPIRAGLLFLSLDTFVASLGLIAYMILLATVLHPAVAATVAAIFSADAFYTVQVWTTSAIRSGNASKALHVLDRLFHYLYMALPMFHPYAAQTRDVYNSLRVAHGEWKYLLFSLGYALTLSLFCYLLALVALQRHKHI
jgi:ABC-type transport system involved in multi-copper enzyme maturation permease subunit